MEFRGYQSTYVASLPPVADDAAVPAARLALPAAGQGLRPRPGRPVRLGRRAARAAARRAARGGRGRDARGRRGPALDVLAAVRVADGHRRRRWTGGHLPGAAGRRRRPAGRLAAHRQRRRPRRSGWPLLQAAPAYIRRGAAGHRRAPRSRPGSTDVVDGGGRATCSPTTRGSGARCGCPGSPRSPRRRRRRRRRRAFNAVYGQVPGELAPKLALALACETSGEHDVAESLYVDLRAHRRQLHRPGGLRPGPDPRRAAATSTARSPPSTSCRRPAGRFTSGPAPAGRAAGRLGPGTARPRRRRWAASSPSPSTRVDRASAAPSTCCSAALDQVRRRRRRARRLDRRAPGGGAGPARRARGAPTASWPATPRPASERVRAGRPGQRRPTMDVCDDATCPCLLDRGRATERAVLRGVRRRRSPRRPRCASPPAPAARPPTAAADRRREHRRRGRSGATADRSPTRGAGPARACGGDGRRRRLLRDVRRPGGRARATTSSSSPRRGWPPSATGASGTPATRTRSPSPPTPSRARRAVLVVCDGVSSSTDSDVASLAAARAARDVLAASDPPGLGTAASPGRG